MQEKGEGKIKKKRINYDQNGYIKIAEDNDSKSIGDRFRGRSSRLVKKAKELEVITGGVVTSFKIIAPPGKGYKNIPQHMSSSLLPTRLAQAQIHC